jgi:VIT1/CCC1 family predicted Fe2+/Mn2+ transporter
VPIVQQERHRIGRIGWLRAAVLGANDGILSTASLVLGVATAHATHAKLLIAGVAGLVAGTMSMAAGEYVSVHTQADTEHADLKREAMELHTDDRGEHKELAAIYVARGLDPTLAKQVAQQLMAYDALGAHARDELGISKTVNARPVQAALASAASFATGAAMPLLVAATAPATAFNPPCRRHFVGIPRDSGRIGGAHWRSTCDGRRSARHVLGGAGDGGNRRRRGAVRNSRMNKVPPTVHFETEAVVRRHCDICCW